MAFGLSFAPPTTPDRREQASAAAQLGPTQRAIQVLSLHLPRILGARAISPFSLLTPDRPAAGPLSPEAALTQNAIKASGSPLAGGASDIASQLADLLTAQNTGTAFDQFAPKTPDLAGARPIPTPPDQPAPSGPKIVPTGGDTTPRIVVNNPDENTAPSLDITPFGGRPFIEEPAGSNIPGFGGPTETIAAPTGPNVYTAPGAESRLAGGVNVNPLTVDEIRRRFSTLSALRR